MKRIVVTIVVAFFVLGAFAQAPTLPPTGFNVSARTNSSITVTWVSPGVDANRTNYLLLANTTGTFTDPTNGSAVTNDVDLTDGSAASFGTISGATLTFNGFTVNANTQYFFRLIPYNAAGASPPQYYLATSVTTSGYTLANQPTAASTAMTFSTITGSSITVGLTAGDGAFRLLVARQGSAVSFTPTDGTSYTVDNDFSTSADLGSGNKVVGGGAGNSFVVNGLSGDQVYHFAVFEFNGTAGTSAENYFSTSLVGNRDTEPTTQANTLTVTGPTATALTLNWTSGNGSRRVVLIHESAAVDATPADLTTYTVSNNWNSGSTTASQIGTGNYIVYDGTGTSVSMSNLNSNTAYHFAVFEYNGAGLTTAAYLTPGATASRFSLATQPSVASTLMTFSTITNSSITVGLTAGNGANRVLVARQGSAVSFTPVDGTTYAVDNNYTTSTDLGSGNKVVGAGNGSSFVVNGLSGDQVYHFAVFEFNGTAGTGAENYFSTALTGNRDTEPTTQASALNFSGFSTTGLTLNWTNGNGSRRVVLIHEGAAVDADPADFTTYTVSNNWNSGSTTASEIGTGNYIVFDGTGTSVAMTNLISTNVYHFAVYEYNGAGLTSSAYLTPAAVANHATLAAQPASQSTAMTFSTITASSITVGVTAGSGPTRILVARQGSAVSFTPVDGTSYAVDNNYTTSTDLGSGNKIVGAGAGTSFVVNGLSGDQVYHFAMYEFAGTAGSGSENYLTTSPLLGNRDTEPTTQASALNFSAFSTTGLTLAWTNGNGSRRVVLMHQGAAVDADPADFTTYTVSNNWNSGAPTSTQIGTGNYIMYDGTGSNVAISNLLPDTFYHFAVYEYNGAGLTTSAYMTPGAIINRTTLATLPLNSPTSLTFANVTSTAFDLNWVASAGVPAPTGYIVLRRIGASPTGVPTNGTTYAAGNVIGDGTVAYVGSALTFNDNPLLPVTNYFYDVIAYSGSAGSTNYRGTPLSNNQLTPCTEPTVQASAVTFGTTTASSIVVNWVRGNGNNVIVFARDGVLDATNPGQGSAYTANNTFGSGTAITIPGNDYFAIYSGTGTTVTLNNLSGGAAYNFKVYEYNTANTCYMLSAAPATGDKNTAPAAATTTLTAGTGVATIPSTVNAVGGALGAFTFTLTDVGGDGTSTRFSQLIFRQAGGNQIADWTQLIAGAQLYDNFPNGGIVPGDHDAAIITANSITIPNVDFGGSSTADNTYLGCIVDNTNKIYTLRVWLKPALGGTLPTTVDNLILELSLAEVDVLIVPGKTGIVPGANTRSGPANDKITVTATKIDVATQPSATAFAAVALSTQPIFEAKDANNNRDLDFAQAITVVTSAPSNLGANSAPANFAAGIADFTASGFNFPSVGTSTMEVTTPSINSANSQNTISITVSGSNESTIVENTGFSYPTSIDYTQYQQSGTLVGATTTAVRVAEFTIEDGGADLTDPDGLATILTGINFNFTNPGNIRLVGIHDGTGIVASQPGGASVNFSGLNISAGDGASKTIGVYVSFNTNVTDNVHFEFQINSVTQSAAGSIFAFSDGAAGTGGAKSSVTGTDNVVVVTATELRYTVQPSNTLIGIAMSGSPAVQTTDALGSRDLDYSGTATLTSDGVLSTAPTAPIASGVGAFTAVIHSDKATLRRLTATLATLPIAGQSILSNVFDLTSSNNGDIVRDATINFAEPTNIPYANFQTTDITGGAGDVQVAQFVIRDGGVGVTDTDNAPLLMSSITMSVSNSNQLRRIALYDDAGVELGEVPAAASVTFPGLNGGLGYGPTDNGTRVFKVRVSFINTPGILVDNTQFQFQITNTATTVKSSSFNLATAGGASSDISVTNANRVEVTASQLVYTTQWAALAAQNYDAPVLTSPVLQARDANSIVDLDYAPTPTVSSGLSLANTTLINTSGTITFPPTFQFTSVSGGANGAVATITVDDGSLSAVSNSTVLNYSGISDIVRDPAFSYNPSTVNIPYHTFQSGNIIADANDIVLERFLLRDGGSTLTDADGTATKLNSITIDVTNWQNLRQLALYNGATEVKELNVASNITIPNILVPTVGRITFDTFASPFAAGDNSSQALSIRASFLGSGVTDNQIVTFSVFALGVNTVSSSQLATTSPIGVASTATGNENKIEVTADRFNYTSIPLAGITVFIGQNLTVNMEARDINQNIDLDFAGSITAITTNGLATNPATIASGNFLNGFKSYSYNYLTSGTGTITTTTSPAITINQASPVITVSESFESRLYLDPSFTFSDRIDYINHQEATNPSSFKLAQFVLSDGDADGTPGDQDNAPTILEQFTVSLTNSNYIKKIAVYDAAGIEIASTEQIGGASVTFGSVGTPLLITALDELSTTFSVRASYDFNNVIDLQNIQMTVTSATVRTVLGSSKFRANVGDVGGVPIASRQTPSTGKNIVDVVATKLNFVQSPPSFVGTRQPVPLPSGTPVQVNALDANNRLDLEVDAPSNSQVQFSMAGTPSSQLQTIQFPFAAGFATIVPDQLKYLKAGDGTLTANLISPPPTVVGPVTPGVSTSVNVIQIDAAYSFNNVTTTANLAGGSIDKVIYGVTFSTIHPSPGPKLRRFVISFDNNISSPSVLKNPRVYEQVNQVNYFGGTDVTDPTIKGIVTQQNKSITVDFTGTGGVPRDFTGGKTYTYFLMVDVESTANSLTPAVTPFVEDKGWVYSPTNAFDPTNTNIIVSPLTPTSLVLNDKGGALADGTATKGKTFSFAAIFPPKLASSNPANGAINANPKGQIVLNFDVPVWTLDRKIKLYSTVSPGAPGIFVADLPLVGTAGSFDPLAAPPIYTNPVNIANLSSTLTFDILAAIPAGLAFNQLYYITIAPVDIAQTTGIRDQAGNKYAGISSPGTLYFRTSSNIPVTLLDANNSAVQVPSSIINISLTGATIQSTFDSQGTAYWVLVNHLAPPPSRAQILGTGVNIPGPGGITGSNYASALIRGSFPIVQVAPYAQYGTIDFNFTNGNQYDVWMFAANNDLPNPIPTTGPYGPSTSFLPVVDNTGAPTFTFTASPPPPPSIGTVNIFAPSQTVCASTYQPLNNPIQIVERNFNDLLGSGSGTQTFNMLLPTGFVFDTSSPIKGNVILSATGDFVANSGSLSFLSSSVVQVSYDNTGSSASIDNITISGLRVLAAGPASGSIVKLGGSVSNTVMPDGTTVFGTISSSNSIPVGFINSYNGAVTFLPDEFKLFGSKKHAVQLIPVLPTGDVGPTFFSGNGVTLDSLHLNAVTLSQPFNITVSHTDMNGCLSTGDVQYLVYDHTTGLGIKTEYCITPQYFPVSAPYADVKNTVKFDAFPGFYLTNLSTQTVNGPFLNTLPAPFPNPGVPPIPALVDATVYLPKKLVSSGADPSNNPHPGVNYFDYNFYVTTIGDSTVSTFGPSPAWDTFAPFVGGTTNGNRYYTGGNLGTVEFKGLYQSIPNVLLSDVPLLQNADFYAPALIYIEVNGNLQSSTDPLAIKIDPTGTGLIPSNDPVTAGYAGTFNFCQKDGTITFNAFPAASSTSTGVFTLTKAVPPYLPIVVALPADFKDNGNGTATLNPNTVFNNYDEMRLWYTYQDNNSPCKSQAYIVIRVTPNPISAFTTSTLCEDVPIAFTDGSSILGAGAFPISNWDWKFSDPNSSPANNISSLPSPTHIYSQPGSYLNITLDTWSSVGCKSVTPASQNLSVGGTPTVGIKFDGVSVNDTFNFRSDVTVTGVSSNDTFSTMEWDFGDGAGMQAPMPYSTATQPKLYSGAPGRKVIDFRVTSGIGCINSLSASGILPDNRTAIVLPVEAPTPVIEYDGNFNTNDGSWQAWYAARNASDMIAPVAISWNYGQPTKFEKNIASSDTSNIQPVTPYWSTNELVSGTHTYNPQERSALYSPAFNLSGLARPMISFNSIVQMATGDGLVVEYSIDSKNVADVTKAWLTLGEVGGGTDWYNGQGIVAKPGNQASGDIGWEGSSGISTTNNKGHKWTFSKHALVDAGGLIINQAQVVFRFALAANPNSTTVGKEGFALDNVRIGERTRTILLESFANTANTNTGGSPGQESYENSQVASFNAASVGLEVVKLNYHVSFPGSDPFNKANAADPGARALYYNIDRTPNSRLDGESGPGGVNQPFSAWGPQQFATRSLQLAEADIQIRPTTTNINDNGKISVMIDVTPKIDLDPNTVLHVAVMEQVIPLASLSSTDQTAIGNGSQETQFEYVVKKMLPDAAGTLTSTKALAGDNGIIKAGSMYTFGPIEWAPGNMPFYTPNVTDLAVGVFLQDQVNRTIYQSEIVSDLDDPATSTITGLEPIPADRVIVYPVPADLEMTIILPGQLQQKANLVLFDQLGKVAHNSSIPEGSSGKTISTSELSAGVYILQIETGPGMVTRKKVMVVH